MKLVLDYVRAANKNALHERTADKESEGGEDDAYEGSKNTSCGWPWQKKVKIIGTRKSSDKPKKKTHKIPK